jgi:hypothetical protein
MKKWCFLFISFICFSINTSQKCNNYQKINNAQVAAYFSLNTLNRAVKSWAFPIYMGGANNLESFLDLDVEEMLSVGSTVRTNIVTQEAKNTETKRYYIEKNNHELLLSLGQINSAGSDNLKSFLQDMFVSHPSDRLCLILWDHGYGPEEPPFTDARSQKITRSLIRDDNYPAYNVFGVMADVMKANDLVSALSEVCTQFNRKFDIIAFNACQMMSVEILSKVSPYCNYVVGSEVPMYACGFGYDLFLSIFETQTLLPKNLCELITTTFEQEVKRKELDFYELSSVYADLNVSTLEAACGSVGDYLALCLDCQLDEAVLAKLGDAAFDGIISLDTYELPDLSLFCRALLGTCKINETDLNGSQDPSLLANLETALNSVVSLIDLLVFKKVFGGLETSITYGMTIYFPIFGSRFYSSYQTLNFADNKWWNFIEKYVSYY